MGVAASPADANVTSESTNWAESSVLLAYTRRRRVAFPDKRQSAVWAVLGHLLRTGWHRYCLAGRRKRYLPPHIEDVQAHDRHALCGFRAPGACIGSLLTLRIHHVDGVRSSRGRCAILTRTVCGRHAVPQIPESWFMLTISNVPSNRPIDRFDGRSQKAVKWADLTSFLLIIGSQTAHFCSLLLRMCRLYADYPMLTIPQKVS